MRRNFPGIFESARRCDVIVLVETFLSEEGLSNFEFPPGFLVFSNPALKNPTNNGKVKGRFAGGIVILARSSLFVAKDCKSKCLGPSILSCSLTLKGGHQLEVIGVYRVESERSPVFDANFSELLTSVCVSQVGTEEVLLVGDFNSKIGDLSTELGRIDEFSLLLPNESANKEVNERGRTLLESLSGCDFLLLPLFDKNGKYPVTCKANAKRASESGSVIDFAFVSLPLFQRVRGTNFEFESELSSHAWLEVNLLLPGGPAVAEATTNNVPPRRVMHFDVDSLLALKHTDSLVELANKPAKFTVEEAYEVILEFVGTYTTSRVVRSSSQKSPSLPASLRAVRQALRRIERKIKKCRDQAVLSVLNKKLSDAISVYQSERDHYEEEKRTAIREQFSEARATNNMHLAWKLARLNLSGKGGGVKTSATTAISRTAWETHFATVYANTSGSAVGSVGVGAVSSEVFDRAVNPLEVTWALETKKNMRAPGPDGFRVDFLRVLRFDDILTRAIANFFTLMLNSAVIPDDWDHAFLFVLYKGKGDPSDPNNYRGITLKSHFLKLFETVMCNRFTNWCQAGDLLPDNQLAYRRGLSGTDHLYLLNIFMEDAVARGETLFVGLLDLRKAFPSVDRAELIEDLVQAGVSAKFARVMKRLYLKDTFQLLLDGVPGAAIFVVVIGVHEGSCLSPSLFIFFIRGLTGVLALAAGGFRAPEVGGRKINSMVFADDVNVFAYEIDGTQALVDNAVDFFVQRRLLPNPDKCEFVAVTGRRGHQPTQNCSVQGVARPWLQHARYLGLIIEETGKWDKQLKTVISRSRSALGRLKIMASTVGRHRTKVVLELFDAVVASVYRYGLGVWGVTARQVNQLDNLFVEFVLWLFRLPPSTGRAVILSNFSRRCAKCDALFLASVQLAAAATTKNRLWGEVVADLGQGRIVSTWHRVVAAKLAKRGRLEDVLNRGADFVGDRKRIGVEFSQYCFHHHLNIRTGSSADDLRIMRPFGIFPLFLSLSPEQTRYLLAFLSSSWRYIDQMICSNYPEACQECDQENSSAHVLFVCPKFERFRARLLSEIGVPFSFDCLATTIRQEQVRIARFAKELFFAIAELWV